MDESGVERARKPPNIKRFPSIREFRKVQRRARRQLGSPRATCYSTSRISHIPISRYAISIALHGRWSVTGPGLRGRDQEAEKTASQAGSCR